MFPFGENPDKVFKNEIKPILGFLRAQFLDVGLLTYDEFHLWNDIGTDLSIRPQSDQELLLPIPDLFFVFSQKLLNQALKGLDDGTVRNRFLKLVIFSRNIIP